MKAGKVISYFENDGPATYCAAGGCGLSWLARGSSLASLISHGLR